MADLSPSDVLILIRELTASQRNSADQLLILVNRGRKAGTTWRQLAEAAGMDLSTLYRQAKADSPIVVVRATHTPKSRS